MTTTTDSQDGSFDSSTKEFSNSYDMLWGLVLHSETVQIDKSNVDGDYRTRGFTHTLNITGVHLRAYLTAVAEPKIINIKDELFDYFYGSKANQITKSVDPALFPSIPNEAGILWEPVSLNIAEGTYTDELRYTASLVYKRFPKDTDIQSITLFGKQFWDGSEVSFKRSYDRITKKLTQNTAVSGSISAPNDMSWPKALFFFDQANSLQVTSVSSTRDITDVDVGKNYDKQTVNYSIGGYDILDKGDTGNKINLFGHDWPAFSDISLDSKPLYDTHIAGIDAVIQTVGLSLSISSPDDMEFSDAMKHYQYALNMSIKKTYATFGDIYYRFGIDTGWEIETSSFAFNPSKKTVTISIGGTRIIKRKPISKTSKAVSGGSGFLWTGSKIEYTMSSELENLIFTQSIAISGEAQIPNDMSKSEAIVIESDIKNLKLFDNIKYPGYKLSAKKSHYDKFKRVLSYSLELKKMDFYDPFFISGNTTRYRSPNDIDRSVGFSYGVLSKINGVQFEVQYKEDYSRTEDDNKTFSFNVTGRLITILNEFGKPTGTSVEKVLDQLWSLYVVKDEKLDRGKYICNSASKGISTNKMEGTFSLSFTDFGRDNSGSAFYFPETMGSSGLLVIGEFDEDSAVMRVNSIGDQFSDGALFQENGISTWTIGFNGKVHKKEFDKHTYLSKWKNIKKFIDRNGGYLQIRGVKGRVTRLSMTGIDLVKKTARVSVSIEIQPDVTNTRDPMIVKV